MTKYEYDYSLFERKDRQYNPKGTFNNVSPNFSKVVTAIMPKKVPLLTSTNNGAAPNNNLRKFKSLQKNLVNLNTKRFQLKNSIKQIEKIKAEKKHIELALKQCNEYKVKLDNLKRNLSTSKNNFSKLQSLEIQYRKTKEIMRQLKH